MFFNYWWNNRLGSFVFSRAFQCVRNLRKYYNVFKIISGILHNRWNNYSKYCDIPTVFFCWRSTSHQKLLEKHKSKQKNKFCNPFGSSFNDYWRFSKTEYGLGSFVSICVSAEVFDCFWSLQNFDSCQYLNIIRTLISVMFKIVVLYTIGDINICADMYIDAIENLGISILISVGL